MANTAFNAKFRIVDNNSDRENAPEKNLIIDISVEEAMKMANWLQSMVDNAHVEDTTIRIYKSKSEYDEVAGFSIWGGLWGCLLYTSPSPRDLSTSRMPSSA